MIDKFQGPYRFLSNFWPCEVELDGAIYPSVEHAFQAAKTTDPRSRLCVQQAGTARQAKKLGQQVPYRDDWEEIKLTVMENLLRQKFARRDLQNLLLETSGQELVEGNTWGDRFWGVCGGEGANHLGRLLMKIRDADCSN